MAGLADVLQQYAVLGIDTSPFIYVVEDHPQFGDASQLVLDRLTSGMSRGVTSVVTLMELTVKPLRDQQTEVAYMYAGLLDSLENLEIRAIRARDAWRAGSLRASNTLRPADALQLATCIGAGAEVFVTNDRRFRQINEIDVLILADYT
ncbi:MAG: type II toxin-antitoxin system VapC family toxin [Thermomicrobiales bacterium]